LVVQLRLLAQLAIAVQAPHVRSAVELGVFVAYWPDEHVAHGVQLPAVAPDQ
jgi:hypothetical protein